MAHPARPRLTIPAVVGTEGQELPWPRSLWAGHAGKATPDRPDAAPLPAPAAVAHDVLAAAVCLCSMSCVIDARLSRAVRDGLASMPAAARARFSSLMTSRNHLE